MMVLLTVAALVSFLKSMVGKDLQKEAVFLSP